MNAQNAVDVIPAAELTRVNKRRKLYSSFK